MRDSFIFYRSFQDAIDDLPNEDQLAVYRAISKYSLDFNGPELVGIQNTIFKLIRPQLEANNKRFLNGIKPKKKQAESKQKAKHKQNISKVEANNNVNVLNDNVNDKEKDKDKSLSKKNACFEEIWTKYPKRLGKKAAFRHYTASVVTDQDCIDIADALIRYVNSDDVKRGFIQNGSTWFNNWRDWIDYVPVQAEKPMTAEERYAKKYEEERINAGIIDV